MESILHRLQDQSAWKWLLVGGGVLGVYLIKRKMGGKKCPSDADASGKTVIITGSNCGIGKATAMELARRNARVILACRDVAAAEAAALEIRKKTGNGNVRVCPLDLASLESVKRFADEVIAKEEHIHALINNAGIYGCSFSKTKDGFEMQMGVNHLGHHYLTNLLLDHVKASAPSRIIIVSSGLSKLGQIDFENFNSEKDYDKGKAYRNSKLANNLFARQLAKKLDGTGVSVFSLRPGMVRSNLGRHVGVSPILKFLLWPLAWLLVKSVDEGCQTVFYCTVAPELAGTSDKYFANCKEEPWPENACDLETAKKLWDWSSKLTGLNG